MVMAKTTLRVKRRADFCSELWNGSLGDVDGPMNSPVPLVSLVT